MILVTGATGNVGSELVQALLARGESVRAIARNPSRTTLPAAVDVTSADLEAPETLPPTLAGVRKVFLLGGFATTELLRRVEDAGVEQVVLLTSRCVIGGKPDNAITRTWLDAEAAVANSGVPSTNLRPSGFHSNALRWLPQLRQGDVVRAPWPHVPIAAIDPADIAAVAAILLSEPDHERTALTLSGPQPLTPANRSRRWHESSAGLSVTSRSPTTKRAPEWQRTHRSPSSTRSSASSATASSTTPASSRPCMTSPDARRARSNNGLMPTRACLQQQHDSGMTRETPHPTRRWARPEAELDAARERYGTGRDNS
jgi:uncharacterized protein YbjT (DUF2867 family)